MTPRILIVGVSARGASSLPAHVVGRIACADLLIGGKRQLNYFPGFSGETRVITNEVESLVPRLRAALLAGEKAVVLASGDPLCYGIGGSLRRFFPANALEIVPAPTTFQMAFAALGESWDDAVLLSAHARPLDTVILRALAAPKAAILTDACHTPSKIAEALLAAGAAPETECAVCENLGGLDERIVRTTLAQVVEKVFAPLNVVVVWCLQPSASRQPIAPGIPDEAFSTSASQITKREVRLLSLAELALEAGQVLWDIGAGSGSVGIEAARSQPTARIYSIEKRPELCVHMRENLRRFPAPNLYLTEGNAPKACVDWPTPHAVFIGGSGKSLESILENVKLRLYPGGRLVLNAVTLETLHIARNLLSEASVIQLQVSRGVSILDMLRFEALNPVFIVTWRKKDTST